MISVIPMRRDTSEALFGGDAREAVFLFCEVRC